MISRVLLVVLVCGALTADLRGDSKAKSGAVAIRKAVAHKVIDHHAAKGSGERDTQKLHRGDAAMITKEILAAGFALDGESHLLRNPEDDRTINVFDERVRRKTDRFLLRFQKPKQ